MPSQIIPCIDKKDFFFPKRKTQYSIGYDIYANYDFCLKHNTITKQKTGFKMSLFCDKKTHVCHYAKIIGRSSLLSKGIIVLEGLIDPDYKEEVLIMFFNHSGADYNFYVGDRIAQIIIIEYNLYNTELVDNNNKRLISENINRKAGFGSTGK